MTGLRVRPDAKPPPVGTSLRERALISLNLNSSYSTFFWSWARRKMNCRTTLNWFKRTQFKIQFMLRAQLRSDPCIPEWWFLRGRSDRQLPPMCLMIFKWRMIPNMDTKSCLIPISSTTSRRNCEQPVRRVDSQTTLHLWTEQLEGKMIDDKSAEEMASDLRKARKWGKMKWIKAAIHLVWWRNLPPQPIPVYVQT